MCASGLGKNGLPLPTLRLQLLVAVRVLLTAHVTIVLYIASFEVLADVLVILDIIGSQISVAVSIDGVEVPMLRGSVLHIVLAGLVRIGGRACEDQRGARQ